MNIKDGWERTIDPFPALHQAQAKYQILFIPRSRVVFLVKIYINVCMSVKVFT